jgi:hypothetical protein
MMHPQYRIDLLHERERGLEDSLSRSRLLAEGAPPKRIGEETVSLRLCTVHDDAALERLALLNGVPLPGGRFVVAEVDGELVAALSLRGGEPLADPFRPTAHLIPLLRLRAGQIDGQTRPRMQAARAIAAKVLHPAK